MPQLSDEEIAARLFSLRDGDYARFQARLIPTVAPERIIGVRTPALRTFARELAKDGADGFLRSLPHRYFDENQLHAFIISREKDFERCVRLVEAFLPSVDNWATCDQLLPAAFKAQAERLLPHIERWLSSGRTYTVRFAVGLLMQHFLDGRFSPEYPAMVCAVRSDEYYVNMMAAWYFATALAKQYDAVLPFIEGERLSPWVHNKAIQKATESRRITPARKEYLRSLKVR